MIIETNRQDGELIFILTGRLDTNTSPDLEEALETEITDEIQKLIIDMKDIEYISSAGLRVMVVAQGIMDDKEGLLVLRNVNSIVMEVFELTGFSNMLTFE